MKKITFEVVLFFLFTHVVSSQDTKLKADILWGERETTAQSDQIIFNDESGIYTLRTAAKKKGVLGLDYILSFSVEHYNYQLQKDKSVLIDFKDDNKENDIKLILELNNEIFFFFSTLEKNPRRLKLYAQKLDKKSLDLDPIITHILELDLTGTKDPDSKVIIENEISEDGTKIILYTKVIQDNRDYKDDRKYTLTVFDNTLKKLWEKLVTKPKNEDYYDVIDTDVDNYGNAHLLCTNYGKTSIVPPLQYKINGTPNFKYSLVSFMNKGSEIVEMPIETEEWIIRQDNILMLITDNNTLILGGFFSDHRSVDVKGTFLIIESLEKREILINNFQLLDNKDSKHTNLRLTSFIARNNGDFSLLGEVYNVSDGGIVSSYYILAAELSPTGNLNWKSIIRKAQNASDIMAIEYIISHREISKDKDLFFFIDNPANINFDGKEGSTFVAYNSKINKVPESILVLVEVDQAGNQKRQSLFSTEGGGSVPEVHSIYKLSDNEFLFIASSLVGSRLGKITFKE